jgi:hypothetical protein
MAGYVSAIQRRFAGSPASAPGAAGIATRRAASSTFVAGPAATGYFSNSTNRKAVNMLLEEGWRVMTVWECALKGKTAHLPLGIAHAVSLWLGSSEEIGEITGTELGTHYSVDRQHTYRG